MIYRNRVNVGTTINTLPYVVAALPALVNSFSAGAATGLTPNTATTGNVVLGGTLAATNGGTGVVSPTAGSAMIGNGASAVSLVAPSTVGNLLTSTGATWASQPPVYGKQFVSAAMYSSIKNFSGTSMVFNSAGSCTWTCPANVTYIELLVIGGGGGGASNGNSGGYGGYGLGTYTVVPGTAYAITIGAGGAGWPSASHNGTAGGGTSSFSTIMSATGGAVGLWSGAVSANGSAALANVINSNIYAQTGQSSWYWAYGNTFAGPDGVNTPSTTAQVWGWASTATSGGWAGILCPGAAGETDFNFSHGGMSGIVLVKWIQN